MDNPTLRLHDLAIQLGDQTLIGRLNAKVDPGTVLGVFGDSGVGKSSLLHAIAGLLHPPLLVEGTIALEGQAIEQCDASERSLRGISIVLQDLGLFNDRSVAENLAYPLRRRGWTRADIEVAVRRSLARFSIGQEAGKRPDQLSGGQRQRVAFARALIYDPRLLLLDEPLRGLQDELRYEFLAMLRALCDEGTAMVVVSHDREEVALIADSVLHMRAEGFTIEQRRPGAGFACLRPSAPAPAAGNALRFDLLRAFAQGQAQADEYRLVILDVRETPRGADCALVRVEGRAPAWVQLTPDAEAVPGTYWIDRQSAAQLHREEN